MAWIGLNEEQVRQSREKYGSNQLTEQKREGFLKKLGGNFGDPMIRILCVALVINLVFAFMGETHWYEAAGIALAVVLAVLISTFSEYRNESAFQKLKEEADQIRCKVYRSGSLVEMPIRELVVGDLIVLQMGDKIPADGVMRDGTIRTDQSALNGETEEAEKRPVPKGEADPEESLDFLNPYKVFRGSVVVGGTGLMEASLVGDRSVYGQLAGELQMEGERDSPLKLKLRGLATGISRFGYIGGILIALAFLFQTVLVHNGFDPGRILAYIGNGMPLLTDLLAAVMLAVIIIVMAVPEGLPLMIAIVSAQNMGKMLKDQVLVRKVTGIETAGSLNILFSDKTGTITKGKLETVVVLNGKGESYEALTQMPEGYGQLVTVSIRSNTGAVLTQTDGVPTVLGGNATERALLQFVSSSKEPDVTIRQSLPFDSTNKFSVSTVQGEQNLTLIKGAPEKLLSRCTQWYGEAGVPEPLGPMDIQKLEAEIDSLASRAIRVLVLATAPFTEDLHGLPEGDWTLVGVVGIRDEVRPEAVIAIDEVQRAGVQVVMITGDRKDTATAIAWDAGILRSEDEVILTSEELATYSDEQIKEMLPKLRVIARALPSDKSRLVRLAQAMNLVVGMTGDGVNDSPALKRADVGFAMGSGTEVAKEAGDIVILDDNFQSVAKAVLYGRTIYNSIRKFIVFQLTINVSAVLISFVAPLLGMESPLSITQILWINLVMDTLAALAFGGEAALAQYMDERPRRRDESILSPSMKSAIFVGSLWTLAVSLFFLLSPVVKGFFRPDGEDLYHMTGFFAFFIFTAIFNAFNARTQGRNLFAHMKKNPGFLRILGLIVVVQVALTYLGGAVFRSYGLNMKEWLVVLGFAVLIIPVDILRKTFMKSREQTRLE